MTTIQTALTNQNDFTATKENIINNIITKEQPRKSRLHHDLVLNMGYKKTLSVFLLCCFTLAPVNYQSCIINCFSWDPLLSQ